jgi:predicted porin
VAAAPVAFAATSNVDVYGQARVALSNNSNGGGMTVTDQASRVGIKGSEDLGGGMAAIWQWESQLNNLDVASVSSTAGPTQEASAAANASKTAQRNTFVGIKGAFGTALAGVHDTPYKMGGSADLFGDTAADSQKSGTGIIGRNGLDNRSNNAVAYISPDFNGFHAGVATVASESGAMSSVAATSAVLVYVNGPLKATYGHEKFAKSATNMIGQKGDKLNVSYKLGDTTMGATYEKSQAVGTVPDTAKVKDTAYLVSVAHAMGPITLAAQYGKFDDKNSTADLKRTTVGAIYALSKRTNVALAYNADDNQTDPDVKTTTLQLNHSF